MFWLLIVLASLFFYTVLGDIYRVGHPVVTKDPINWALAACEHVVWTSVILYAAFNWV